MEAATPGRSRKKLTRGVRLALLSPEWNRPCAACEQWWYQDDGRVKRDAGGEPVPRPKGAPTPCQSCAKVPKWAKEQGKEWDELRKLADEISLENEAAYEAYREFRATNSFPDDPIVRWYSALIREVEEEAATVPVQNQTAAINALLHLLVIRSQKR